MSNNEKSEKVSLSYLIWIFLKIGTISFGGFMALIAVLQKEMVEKDKKLHDHVLLDGVSLASILPGPVAVNTVGYVGYHLRGFWGALVSMAAVILPCFVLVLGLSVIYFEYGNLENFKLAITIMMPAIVVIVLSVAINMTKKHISEWIQYVIAIVSFVTIQWMGGIWSTFIVIFFGGVLGYLFYGLDSDMDLKFNKKIPRSIIYGVGIVILLIGVGLLMIFLVFDYQSLKLNSDLLFTFSGMSLSLFGGGYVIIPIIQETIVSQLNWLTLEEFNTAIALSQITPGPILISATFIGYKVAGLTGACLATIGIFLPSGLLIIACSHYLLQLKKSKLVESIFKGLRPAVIGLIFSAAWTIGYQVLNEWIYALSFVIMLGASLRYKLSAILVILGTVIIGLLGLII